MRAFCSLIVILFLSNLELNGQGLLMDYIDPQYQNTKLLYDQKYDKVDGNPYYLDDFVPSKVVLSNTKIIDTLLLKLDLFENNIIFKSGKRELVMNQQFIKSVSVFNSSTDRYHSFKYLKIEDGQSLAEILTENKKGGLYKIYKKKLVKLSESVGYGVEASGKKSYLSNKEITVLMVDDRLFELSKLSNKIVLSCFSNPDPIAQYIDKQKLNCKNETDLILIISYYDQIN